MVMDAAALREERRRLGRTKISYEDMRETFTHLHGHRTGYYMGVAWDMHFGREEKVPASLAFRALRLEYDNAMTGSGRMCYYDNAIAGKKPYDFARTIENHRDEHRSRRKLGWEITGIAAIVLGLGAFFYTHKPIPEPPQQGRPVQKINIYGALFQTLLQERRASLVQSFDRIKAGTEMLESRLDLLTPENLNDAKNALTVATTFLSHKHVIAKEINYQLNSRRERADDFSIRLHDADGSMFILDERKFTPFEAGMLAGYLRAMPPERIAFVRETLQSYTEGTRQLFAAYDRARPGLLKKEFSPEDGEAVGNFIDRSILFSRSFSKVEEALALLKPKPLADK